jgi:hypothetical protein
MRCDQTGDEVGGDLRLVAQHKHGSLDICVRANETFNTRPD